MQLSLKQTNKQKIFESAFRKSFAESWVRDQRGESWVEVQVQRASTTSAWQELITSLGVLLPLTQIRLVATGSARQRWKRLLTSFSSRGTISYKSLPGSVSLTAPKATSLENTSSIAWGAELGYLASYGATSSERVYRRGDSDDGSGRGWICRLLHCVFVIRCGRNLCQFGVRIKLCFDELDAVVQCF